MIVKQTHEVGMRKIISQGDVVFIPIEQFPPEFVATFTKPKGNNVIAEGDVTGHAHRVNGGEFELLTQGEIKEAVSMMLIRIKEECLIEHEEHESFPIQGDYIAVIQQEIDPFEGIVRQVQD